jgi:hypothetical protein
MADLPRLTGNRILGAADSRSARSIEAFARPLVVALLAGTSLAAFLAHWQGVFPRDMADYWDAALRLRAGEELYVAGLDGRVSEYRYAPWFAYLWVPLTFLPRDAVTVAWIVLMAVMALAVTVDVGRRGWEGLALALVLGVQLFWWVRGGNVQPLMIAALYFGLGRRWGPVAVAGAATLKIVPIFFVLVYVGRREWSRVAWTLAITLVLAAPVLLYDLGGYGTGVDSGDVNRSLFVISPVIWGLVAIIVAAVAFAAAMRRSWATPAWAATAAIASLPRLFLGDLTLLLPALARFPRAADPPGPPEEGSAGL